MSAHLQECYCYSEEAPGPQALCICKRLRSCEARVVAAVRDAAKASNPDYTDGCRCEECTITTKALAAIDALKGESNG